MATKIGVLHLEVMIHDALTLKDKRRVVKSFKDRTAAAFNVSVAEVGYLDNPQRATLALAMVGNDGRYIQGALQQIVNAARGGPPWVLLDYDIEVI